MSGGMASVISLRSTTLSNLPHIVSSFSSSYVWQHSLQNDYSGHGNAAEIYMTIRCVSKLVNNVANGPCLSSQLSRNCSRITSLLKRLRGMELCRKVLITLGDRPDDQVRCAAFSDAVFLGAGEAKAQVGKRQGIGERHHSFQAIMKQAGKRIRRALVLGWWMKLR